MKYQKVHLLSKVMSIVLFWPFMDTFISFLVLAGGEMYEYGVVVLRFDCLSHVLSPLRFSNNLIRGAAIDVAILLRCIIKDAISFWVVLVLLYSLTADEK